MGRQNENFKKYQAMPKFLDTIISSFCSVYIFKMSFKLYSLLFCLTILKYFITIKGMSTSPYQLLTHLVECPSYIHFVPIILLWTEFTVSNYRLFFFLFVIKQVQSTCHKHLSEESAYNSQILRQCKHITTFNHYHC